MLPEGTTHQMDDAISMLVARISAILDGSLGFLSRFKLDLSFLLHLPTSGQLVLS